MNSDQPIPPELDDKPYSQKNLGAIGAYLSLIAPLAIMLATLIQPG